MIDWSNLNDIYHFSMILVGAVVILFLLVLTFKIIRSRKRKK